MKEIREWLEKDGPDYAQGVALYAAHGKSRVVLAALQRGPSDFTRQKLLGELRKLAIAGAAVATKSVLAIDALPKRVDKTPVPAPIAPQPTEMDPDACRQRSAWFAERNRLHAQLELVATDAERHRLAGRILVLAELIGGSYDAQPGQGSDPARTPGRIDLGALADAGEIRRLLYNLRPQRTKLKKRPDRAPELAQVEADINYLEQRLKSDGGEPKL